MTLTDRYRICFVDINLIAKVPGRRRAGPLHISCHKIEIQKAQRA